MVVSSSLDKDFDDIFGTPRPRAQATEEQYNEERYWVCTADGKCHHQYTSGCYCQQPLPPAPVEDEETQDYTTLARPDEPGYSPNVSSLTNNAGLLHEVAPASYTPPLANQLIIEAGRASYEVITARIENILASDGLMLDDLGMRYEKAWELFEVGGWELRAEPHSAFRVDSQETTKKKKDKRGAGNLEYRVYCKDLPGHREAGYANSCECWDSTHDTGAGGKMGYCKHVLLLLIVWHGAELVKAERRRQVEGEIATLWATRDALLAELSRLDMESDEWANLTGEYQAACDRLHDLYKMLPQPEQGQSVVAA